MLAEKLTPILNVSDIRESFAWFEKLGWKKGWDWGDPPTFGGVRSGECEIFLCQGAQGGRGNGGVKMTFGPDGDQAADKGAWMSIWVDGGADAGWIRSRGQLSSDPLSAGVAEWQTQGTQNPPPFTGVRVRLPPPAP